MAKLSSSRELLNAKLEHDLFAMSLAASGAGKRKPDRYAMLAEAAQAERKAKAEAHVNYRRALMRAHSTSVQVNKKYRPDILMRRKDTNVED